MNGVVEIEALAELKQRLDEIEVQGVRPIRADELEVLLMAAKNDSVQVAFRLDQELLKRLDKQAQRMTEEQPGVEFTRSTVVRLLLLRGLDELEAKRGGKK